MNDQERSEAADPSLDPRVRALQAGALGHALEGGARLIHEERVRQVRNEGWTPEHDDEHADGALIVAALCYARESFQIQTEGPAKQADWTPLSWPWDSSWWKPSDDPIRNLVKAGALIAAEIDRLQRASASPFGRTA